MHMRIVLLALLTALAPSCKTVDCGDGTIERDGVCVPSNETVGTAQCGPLTRLDGTLCVPMFPPTQCDPDTTEEDKDSAGVITCIGTGGGGCSARLACPAPMDPSKQTICGQIYDFENNEPFAQPDAMGTQCTPGATTGPCALGIRAYDAVVFAQTTPPATPPPLATGEVYIDDCGRYRVSEITQPGPPGLIALGFDDATQPGPAGLTNAVGVATAAVPNSATKDLEAFIARKAMTDSWAAAGGPTIATGFYAPVFRGHRTGTDLVAGVNVTFGLASAPPPMNTETMRDFYFGADATTRTTLVAADVTGVNGTALFSGANLGEIYSGQGGGLPAQCRFDIHGGASVPGVVFIQIFRPINNGASATCPL
jgi:hypothetical protein